MLNIIFVTRRDVGYEIAVKLHQEGNLVKFYNTDNFTPTTKGDIKRIYSVEESLKAADLIIASTPIGTSEVIEYGVENSIPVFGSGKKAEVLARDQQIQDLINKMFYLDKEGISLVVGLYRQGNKWADFSTISTWFHRIMDNDIGPVMAIPTAGWSIEGSDTELIKQVKESFGPTFDGIYGPVTLPILAFKEGFGLSHKVGRGIFLDCNLYHIMVYSELVRKEGLTELFFNLATDKRVSAIKDKAVAGVTLWNAGTEDVVLDPGALKHSWPLTPDARIVVLSAAGDTFREAGRRLIRTMRNVIKTPNVAFRSDGLTDALFTLDQLVEWEWIDAAKVRNFKRNLYSELKGTDKGVQDDRKDRELQSGKSGKSQETSPGHSVQ